jgi:hypothetical protein
MIKIIKGIYLVQQRWDLVWLQNKNENISEYLNYIDFRNLLIQKFNEDQVKKIIEYLTTEYKLIIDFDNSVVKLIKEKEINYLDSMQSYFTAEAAREVYQTLDEFKESLEGKYL